MVTLRASLKSFVLLGALGFALIPETGLAQTCSTTQYPYPLQNGGVADAGQVMADLDCAPVHELANYNGNVGIGLANPPQKLWVENGEIWASGNSRLGFSTDGAYDDAPNVAFGASGNDAYIANWNGGGYYKNLVVVGANGFVGIGTVTPAATLHVNGSAILSQGYSMTSDARLKRDVRPITEGLGLVLKLAPVRYRWRPIAERTVGKDLNLPLNVEQVGFLAQYLEKVVPEAVNRPANKDETYSINEDKLIPFLVQAIKYHLTEIQKLNARIDHLEHDK